MHYVDQLTGLKSSFLRRTKTDNSVKVKLTVKRNELISVLDEIEKSIDGPSQIRQLQRIAGRSQQQVYFSQQKVLPQSIVNHPRCIFDDCLLEV